jgi:hypothetical protein
MGKDKYEKQQRTRLSYIKRKKKTEDYKGANKRRGRGEKTRDRIS